MKCVIRGPVGNTTGETGTRILIIFNRKKIMDNIKKKDLVVEATWPMVATLVTGVALLKLVKKAIELSGSQLSARKRNLN